MRQTATIWAALATAALTANVALGQELLFELAPPVFTPFDVPSAEIASLMPEIDVPAGTAPVGLGVGGSDMSVPATGEPSPTPATGEPGMNTPGMGGSVMGGMGMGSFGMGGPGMGGMGMGGPGMGGPGYGTGWYPSRPVSGSVPEADLGLVRQNLMVAVPVWRGAGDFVMLSAGVRNATFFTDVILPDSHRSFPNELWNVTLGTMYGHKFDNGWSGGLGVNFGSASDKPFHSIDEMNVGFMSFLQVPVRNERDAWRFSLMYSPVGNLSFPMPGVAYLWNPSDAWRVSIGLPFSVMWRPVEDLTINVMYMPIITVNARATYRLLGKVFIYGGFESLQEAYLLADREVVTDRFMGFEKRLLGGVRWDVWQHAAVDLNAGYAFDRYYGVGKNQIGNLHDQVDVAPGAFTSMNFSIRF